MPSNKSGITDKNEIKTILGRYLEGYIVWVSAVEPRWDKKGHLSWHVCPNREQVFHRFKNGTQYGEDAEYTVKTNFLTKENDPLDKSRIKKLPDDLYAGIRENFGLKIKDLEYIENIAEQLILAKHKLITIKHDAKKKDEKPEYGEELFDPLRKKDGSDFDPKKLSEGLRRFANSEINGHKLTSLVDLKRLFDLVVSSNQIAIEKDTSSVAGKFLHIEKMLFGDGDHKNRPNPEPLRKLRQGYTSLFTDNTKLLSYMQGSGNKDSDKVEAKPKKSALINLKPGWVLKITGMSSPGEGVIDRFKK